MDKPDRSATESATNADRAPHGLSIAEDADEKALLGENVVICGAGIAGLLAARVLSDFFERVVIVDHDELADNPLPRKGAAQSRQIHVLLVGGYRILADLFPGFGEEAVEHGALYRCLTDRWRNFHGDGWRQNFKSDLWTVFCSRGLLEWIIRRRVLGLPNVEIRTSCQVVGLAESSVPVDGAVCGARTRSVGSENGDVSTITGDLVVDATGRSSTAPKWLRELGYEPPRETVVDGFWAYGGRSFQMRDGWDPGWSGISAMPGLPPERTRGAFLVEQEGGQWLLTLVGCAKDFPRRDTFDEWINDLPTPEFADAIAGATPVSDFAVWRQTFNRMRHYELLRRRPEGLLFFGDSVCSLNPVYAQGMTVATRSALTLRAALTEQLDTGGSVVGLAERFQQALAETVRFPWVIATDADHAIPGSVGDPPSAADAELGRRWRHARLLANTDPDLARLWLETVTFVNAHDWLLHGDVAERLSEDR